MRAHLLCVLAAASAAMAAPGVLAQGQDDLAKQLANPVAALISVPFQLNYDHDIGPARGGERWTLNIQPVVPITLNEDWNVISRTILPLIDQKDIAPGAGSQSGVGDIVQSLFFSPKKPTAGGLIWGVGPVFLLPTASDDRLGSEKWGIGPTGVVLKQEGPWTYGMLANHIWSVAGNDDRAAVSSTFLQPFFTYTTKDVGPMVLEIPAAGDAGSITGTIMDGWQAALEDVGPAGVDKGNGGKYLMLPPGYKDAPPDGYFVLPSQTYQGFALLRSIVKSGDASDIAKAVAYGKQIKLYPLSQAASPAATVFVDMRNIVFDSTIPYDMRFFESLNRMVQSEPWLPRDKAMIDMLRSIGIEKGNPFSRRRRARRMPG